MPVIESAKKALRSSEAKHERNLLVKAELRRALKNVTVESMSKVVSLVDKAAKRDIIHKNKAARIKSALSKITAEAPKVKKVTKTAAKKKTQSKKTVAKKTVAKK